MDKNARISYAGNDYWNYQPNDGKEETLIHEDELRSEGILQDDYTLPTYEKAYSAWKELVRNGGSEDLTSFTFPCPECKRPTNYSAEDMKFTPNTLGICSECWIKR